MKRNIVNGSLLTINGGSSSIKFALFEAGGLMQRVLEGRIERIGRPDATFSSKSGVAGESFSRGVKATNHTEAVGVLMDWLELLLASSAGEGC